jgi:hypothetical protein
MKRFALISALAATLAAPAFADEAANFAFQHFNQDADSVMDIRNVTVGDNGTVVSTRGSSVLAEVFAQLNKSQDSTGDLRGLNGATVISNTPAYGADIFDELRAADLENN